jgi:hypothetical protein
MRPFDLIFERRTALANQALQPTPYSIRSYLASAPRRG